MTFKPSHPTICELMDREEKLDIESRKVRKAIVALQDLCDHKWTDNGHDSHKNHYLCLVCGKTDCW